MTDYSLPDDVVARKLGGETVLVHLGSSEIFTLNETGTRFWELLNQGLSIEDIKKTLTEEYAVTAAEVADEIDSLLANLSRAGLLTVAEDR
jgi:hypothetical protein